MSTYTFDVLFVCVPMGLGIIVFFTLYIKLGLYDRKMIPPLPPRTDRLSKGGGPRTPIVIVISKVGE